MKYCLRSRLEHSYLVQADEIKIEYRDRRSLPDVAMKYPDKTIILQFIPHQVQTEEIDWNDIRQYAIICQGRLICCLHDLSLADRCKELDIKFYWGYPVETFDELRALKTLGVCYVRLGVEIFFSLDRVKAIGIPVRAIPNVAYDSTLPHDNGIHGQWIRSEDVETYEKYIDVFEFEDCDVKKEQALFRIYALGQHWTGNLNGLITNLNFDATSRLIPSSLAEARCTCRHMCEVTGNCHICDRTLRLADVDKLRDYLDSLNQD